MFHGISLKRKAKSRKQKDKRIYFKGLVFRLNTIENSLTAFVEKRKAESLKPKAKVFTFKA